MAANYHEPFEILSDQTKDMHRALTSLGEELEAINWYRQRADVCKDDNLREILLHNMREEMEHAAMVLEWIRRRDTDFAGHLKTYLFTEGAVTELEEQAQQGSEDGTKAQGSGAPRQELSVGIMKGW